MQADDQNLQGVELLHVQRDQRIRSAYSIWPRRCSSWRSFCWRSRRSCDRHTEQATTAAAEERQPESDTSGHPTIAGDRSDVQLRLPDRHERAARSTAEGWNAKRSSHRPPLNTDIVDLKELSSSAIRSSSSWPRTRDRRKDRPLPHERRGGRQVRATERAVQTNDQSLIFVNTMNKCVTSWRASSSNSASDRCCWTPNCRSRRAATRSTSSIASSTTSSRHHRERREVRLESGGEQEEAETVQILNETRSSPVFRGINFQNVDNVINFDFPETIISPAFIVSDEQDAVRIRVGQWIDMNQYESIWINMNQYESIWIRWTFSNIFDLDVWFEHSNVKWMTQLLISSFPLCRHRRNGTLSLINTKKKQMFLKVVDGLEQNSKSGAELEVWSRTRSSRWKISNRLGTERRTRST